MLSYIRLKFTQEDKETLFQKSYLSNYRIMCVQGNVLAMILYGLFTVLDVFALPITMFYTFGIRLIEIVVLGSYAIIVYKNLIPIRYVNRTMILVSIVVGTGINAMIFFSEPGELGFRTYYAGLGLVILWMGSYFRGGMKSYFIACFILTISYYLMAEFRQRLELDVIINNLFFIASTIFLGSLYRYHTEKVHRENFDAFLEVNELKEKLGKQNELVSKQKQEISRLIPKEAKRLVFSKTAKHLEELQISHEDVFTKSEIEKLTLTYKLDAQELLMLAGHKLDMTDLELHEAYFPTKSVRVIKNHFSIIKNKLGLESRKDIKDFLHHSLSLELIRLTVVDVL